MKANGAREARLHQHARVRRGVHPARCPPPGAGTWWTLEAACAGQFELFDTAAALPANASRARVALHERALAAAREMCHTCPVLRACEAASMSVDVGFMAGMTEAERDTRWYAARRDGIPKRPKEGGPPDDPRTARHQDVHHGP